MTELETLDGVETLTKINGTAADETAWNVIDRTKDFGGDVFKVTAESESEYDQYDGMTRTVKVSDVNAGEWEVVE